MNDRLINQLRDFAGDRDGYGYDLARQAATEIDRLNDVTDRMFQQIEQLISDLVDSREETRRHQRHIDRLTNDLTHAINEIGEYQRGER